MKPSILTMAALSAIRFYQRAISPYKGFCCAYCAYTGRASCSALGYRAVRRFGVWDGLAILGHRLDNCGIAYRRYRPRAAQRRLSRQAGSCDLPCDAPGDCAPSSSSNKGFSPCDCATCDCNPFDRKKNRARRLQERDRHIPPRR